MLGVKKSTTNDFIYGELGRMPLRQRRLICIIKYWLKIVHGQKPLYVSTCYQLSLQDIDRQRGECWARSVKQTLELNGSGDVWLQQGVGDIDNFIKTFKCRVRDSWDQEWNSRVEDSSVAIFFKAIKENHHTANT